MKIYRLILSGLFLLILAACGAPPTPSIDPTSAPTRNVKPTLPPQTGGESQDVAGTPEFADTPTPDPAMTQVILIVKADLADRVSIEPDQIELLKSVAIFWPDASLGCPKRGVSYIQKISPGYQIELKAGEDIYEYHTDDHGEIIVLCGQEDGAPFPVIPVTPGEIQDGQPWQPAN